MKLEQRIMIGTEIAGEGNARDDSIEHPAHGDAVQIARVSGEASLWSLDTFRCESIALRSHWVMVVMDQFTRRIIGRCNAGRTLMQAATENPGTSAAARILAGIPAI